MNIRVNGQTVLIDGFNFVRDHHIYFCHSHSAGWTATRRRVENAHIPPYLQKLVFHRPIEGKARSVERFLPVIGVGEETAPVFFNTPEKLVAFISAHY